MAFEFITGLLFGAWSSKRKAKREITVMADRLRRAGWVVQLQGETDQQYVERARVWQRNQQRAAEKYKRDHPEDWDPDVYEEIKSSWNCPPMK